MVKAVVVTATERGLSNDQYKKKKKKKGGIIVLRLQNTKWDIISE